MGKKIYTFKGDSADSVYVKNMVLENGINKKRHGWRVLSSFFGESYEPYPINGIHHRLGEDGLIVHAGNYLYKCSPSLDKKERLFWGDTGTFQNRRSQSCMCGDTVLFGGLGKLLGYGKDGLFSVYEHEKVYVPTTSKSICELYTGKAPEKGEEPNLLTRRRINTMRATKSSRGSHRFLLDGVVDYDSPFTLRVSFRVKCSSDEEDEVTSPYIGKDSSGDEVNTVVTIEDYSPRIGHGTMISHVKAYDANGREITVANAEFRWKVSGGRELILYFDGISPYLNQDNIEVEYSVTTPLDPVLDKACVLSVSASRQGGDVLFINSGDNKIYYSDKERGIYYFPLNNVIAVGGGEALSTIVSMTGGVVIAYKKRSCYWLKPSETGYEVVSASYSMGAENPFAACILGNECISFSGSKAYGSAIEGSGDSQRLEIYERGSALFEETHGDATGNAFAVEHNGVCYLFIGEKAYLANPQSIKGSGRDFQYEWRTFEPCSACCALSFNGTLYMGRKSGEIAVFENGYTDKERVTLTDKDGDFVLWDTGVTILTVNALVNVQNGDKISVGEHFAYATECSFDSESGLIHIPHSAFFDEKEASMIYEGTEVILTGQEGVFLCQGKIDVSDPAECTVIVSALDLQESSELLLYVKRGENTKYELIPKDEGDELHLNGKALRLYSLEVERIYIEREREICCVFCTEITDLGYVGKKTLAQMRLTLSEDTNCIAEIGYETRKNSFKRTIKAGGYFTLGNLQFDCLSFNPKMKRTAIVKCLERNFDHIRIKISSEKGKELGIEELSIVYAENGK